MSSVKLLEISLPTEALCLEVDVVLWTCAVCVSVFSFVLVYVSQILLLDPGWHFLVFLKWKILCEMTVNLVQALRNLKAK